MGVHLLAVCIARILLAMRWTSGVGASINYHLSTINYWIGTTENTEDTEVLTRTNDGICRVSMQLCARRTPLATLARSAERERRGRGRQMIIVQVHTRRRGLSAAGTPPLQRRGLRLENYRRTHRRRRRILSIHQLPVRRSSQSEGGSTINLSRCSPKRFVSWRASILSTIIPQLSTAAMLYESAQLVVASNLLNHQLSTINNQS